MVLPNPKHEAFAQLIARGRNATESYQEVYGNSKGAKESASRLMATFHVPARVSEIQEAAARKVEWALAQRMQFCRDVVETPIGEVDEKSRLCQSAKFSEAGREFKMPDKLRAIELYTKLAGDGAPEKVEHSGSVETFVVMTEGRRKRIMELRRKATTER